MSHVAVRSWCNAGTSDVNPEAVTQIANGTATSTYSYDYAGNRVSQVNGNSIAILPEQIYSVTSSVSSATTTATTTVYVWNGDTLVACTLFVVLTPDGLRAQDTFASSTLMQ